MEGKEEIKLGDNGNKKDLWGLSKYNRCTESLQVDQISSKNTAFQYSITPFFPPFSHFSRYLYGILTYGVRSKLSYSKWSFKIDS